MYVNIFDILMYRLPICIIWVSSIDKFINNSEYIFKEYYVILRECESEVNLLLD